MDKKCIISIQEYNHELFSKPCFPSRVDFIGSNCRRGSFTSLKEDLVNRVHESSV
jgi:hypothetical protein